LSVSDSIMAPAVVEVDQPISCPSDGCLGQPGPPNANALNHSHSEQSSGNARVPREASTTRKPMRTVKHLPGRAQRVRPAAHCRGGIRTSVLSVVGLVALMAIVFIVLARSLGPPEEVSQGSQARGNASTSGAPPVPDSTGGPTINGTISVSPELAGSIPREAVLFIIAHKGSGAPFAVQRTVGPHFPLHYRLGPEDVMLAGTPFEGEVRLSARISRTGGAGPAEPGDLEGERATPVQVGAKAADILISHVR